MVILSMIKIDFILCNDVDIYWVYIYILYFRLDCCIGSSNLRWYLGCLFFSAIAFIYGSNLTITSVCHPFILIGTVLLPDDCSDVYHQLEYVLLEEAFILLPISRRYVISKLIVSKI